MMEKRGMHRDGWRTAKIPTVRELPLPCKRPIAIPKPRSISWRMHELPLHSGVTGRLVVLNFYLRVSVSTCASQQQSVFAFRHVNKINVHLITNFKHAITRTKHGPQRGSRAAWHCGFSATFCVRCMQYRCMITRALSL